MVMPAWPATWSKRRVSGRTTRRWPWRACPKVKGCRPWFNALQGGGSLREGAQQLALQMLAQVAAQSPEAASALVEQARQDQIPERVEDCGRSGWRPISAWKTTRGFGKAGLPSGLKAYPSKAATRIFLACPLTTRHARSGHGAARCHRSIVGCDPESGGSSSVAQRARQAHAARALRACMKTAETRLRPALDLALNLGNWTIWTKCRIKCRTKPPRTEFSNRP